MQWYDAANVTAAADATTTRVKARAVDNSLTSLNWLPEFKIPTIDGKEEQVRCNSIDSDVQNNGGSSPSVISNCAINSDSASSTDSVVQDTEFERDECFLPLSPIKRCLNQTAEFDKNPLRYEENPNKPPFSYTTIIYLAIRSCNKEKVMLSDIYQWIKDHFKYYRIAESTWQNSVRHNLSLNQFFRKIPRGEGDPGKGSFWQINPEYEHILSNDQELQRLLQQQNCSKIPLQRKRSKAKRKAISFSNHSNSRQTLSNNNPTKNITKPAVVRSLSSPVPTIGVDPCHLPGDLDWVTLLSSQRISYSDSLQCKPSFGSPTLSLSDISDNVSVNCSPAALPITLQNRIPDTPPNIISSDKNMLSSSLEEIITTQESPAPLLPPWAVETRLPAHYDNHPWAEVKSHQISPLTQRRRHWSTEVMWSAGSQQPNDKLQIAL